MCGWGERAQVLPAVAGNFSALLSVTAPSGNLLASRVCTAGRFTSGPLMGVCAGFSAALPTCGTAPTVTIPVEAVGPAYSTCASPPSTGCTALPDGPGVPNSDLVSACIRMCMCVCMRMWGCECWG